MTNVVEIKNLYKEYKLGKIGRGTLYRDLQSWWAKIRNKQDPNSLLGYSLDENISAKNILALNNINLNIKKGEIIGIIGSNGAGKSTLLKVLSRITTPTKGTIKIKGTTASLLEVGTGFHSELTGRENIYLNGTINGLNRNQINEIINDIILFSGIGKYIDTPVKRYSSGMFVKLGFSVAAHLSPDILIVDEVLAVGDLKFQKKAMEKMNSISKEENITILFVSHNLDSIKKLCSRVLIVDEGKILDSGSTDDMITKYTGGNRDIRKFFSEVKWKFGEYGPGGSIAKLKSLRTKNTDNKIASNFHVDEEILIEVEFWVMQKNQICTSLYFYQNNNQLFQIFDKYVDGKWGEQKDYEIGVHKTSFIITKNIFIEGTVDINVVIFIPPNDIDSSFQVQHLKRAKGAISFNINEHKNIDLVSKNYPFAYNYDNLYKLPNTQTETTLISTQLKDDT